MMSSSVESAGPQVLTDEDPEYKMILASSAKYFTAEDNTNVLDARTGSYVSVTQDELNKYLPEGWVSSLQDEFKFSRQHKWMIRDSTKLLFRLIEEVEGTLKNGKQPAAVGAGLESVLEIPRLTDRAEWPEAQLQCSVFGKELKIDGPAKAEAGFVVSKGEGSFVENCMSSLRKSGLPNKAMLVGKRGVGKSVALSQAVFHARKRGWLCLYIPNGWEHVQSGPYVEPLAGSGTDNTPMVYDNPHMSASALRGMWHAHRDVLRTMPIREPGVADKYKPYLEAFIEKWTLIETFHGENNSVPFLKMREFLLTEEDEHVPENDEHDKEILQKFNVKTFEVKTLEDLLLVGIALIETSGLAFTDLVRELRTQDAVPVMFAVDGMNTWLDKSAFYYDYQRIMGKQLAVPNSLLFLDSVKSVGKEYTVKNGFCLAATSLTHPEGSKFTFENVKASIPAMIRIPSYSQTEFLSALSFYFNNALVSMRMNVNHLLVYRIHVGSVPGQMRKELFGYTLPFVIEQNTDEIDEALWKGDIGEEVDENDLTSIKEEDSDALGDDEDFEDDEEFEEPTPKGKGKSKGKGKKGKK